MKSLYTLWLHVVATYLNVLNLLDYRPGQVVEHIDTAHRAKLVRFTNHDVIDGQIVERWLATSQRGSRFIHVGDHWKALDDRI